VPDGTREALNQQKIIYFFCGKGCEVQLGAENRIVSAVTVAEFGVCSMMYSAGVIFRMRMPQLTIKVINEGGALSVRNYAPLSRGSHVTRFQFGIVERIYLQTDSWEREFVFMDL
jgi:hypothetical protein